MSALDNAGNWRRRAAKCVPNPTYAAKRQEAWERYTVPAGTATHPKPVTGFTSATTLPDTARLEEVHWKPMPWDENMDINACSKGSTAIHSAYNQLAQQRVGAEDAGQVAWVNTLSRSNLTRSDVTGDVYVKGTEPRGGAPSDDVMRQVLQTIPGGVRMPGGSPESHVMDTPPPRLITPADVGRWPATPIAFPVYVTYPGFGAGLVVRHIVYTTGMGAPGGLFFAVKKFTPLGPVPGEPFSLGIYAVPATACIRMTVAVTQLFPAENIAVIDDFRGDQYSIPFLTLRSTTDPRYEIARRTLLLQYPYLLTDLFATRLRAAPPPDMKPGGAVLPGMVENPAVMIAPSAQGTQFPQ